MIPQPVYLVERPDYANLPTLLEAVGIGFWAYFAVHHHLQPFLSGLCGLLAAGTYVSLHAYKATFWLVALIGMALWGTLGYGIALSIWPDDGLAKGVFAVLGALISLAGKFSIYARANGLPGWR